MAVWASRRGRMGTLSSLGIVVFAGAVATASGCLPDLEPTTLTVRDASSIEGGPASSCGDGFIDFKEGEECDTGGQLSGEAGVQGCKDCKIVCSGAFDPATGHCYFVETAAADVRQAIEANTACSSTDAHLVTFASDREVSFVAENLLKGSTEPYWVGLHYDSDLVNAYLSFSTNEPGWSDRCTGCYARFADGGAANTDGGGCVVASGSGSWMNQECALAAKDTAKIVCEREPAGRRSESCNGPICVDLPAFANTKRYLYFIASETADGAAERCKAAGEGGRVVVIQSREEREQLVREVTALVPTMKTFWIGLSRENETSEWIWADGVTAASETYPLPWGDGEPTSGGQARAYFKFDDLQVYDRQLAHAGDPNVRRPYVCELPARDGG